MAGNPKDYESVKTVVVDSLSHVNEFIIRHVLKMQGKAKKSYEMEARDWSPFKSFAYIFLVGKLELINKLTICTCHEIKIVEGDPQNIMKEKVIGYEPFFQGKVGDTIGAFFSDVWRMEVQPEPGAVGSKTILQTMKHPKCDHLKNSINLPPTLDITKGFSALEPYLKGKI
jgi:hypothetical protein